ncbi:NUDIX hydrolase [Patescibacteria group bacterium]|nr:NUDIX hydrolase [Patescibacteria group bacterium]
MKYKVTIGIFGIITNKKNEVLLVHRNDYDLWNLPGGGLEKGETPWDGLIREVKEETGLDVEVSKLLGVYSKPQKNEIVFNFKCGVVGGELTLNEEASDIRYFDIQNIPKNTSLKHVERIHDYFKDKNKVTMKVQ